MMSRAEWKSVDVLASDLLKAVSLVDLVTLTHASAPQDPRSHYPNILAPNGVPVRTGSKSQGQ